MSHFIDNEDGTVTDTKTNLVWRKFGWGRRMSWEEAKEYAKKLGEGWRVPTIEELCSIVDYSRVLPAIDPVFSCRLDYYWSSNTLADCQDLAWYVYFDVGNVAAGSKSYNYYVRCVRNWTV